MKNKFILGLLLVPALLFTSCGEDDAAEAPQEQTGVIGTWKLRPIEASMAVGPSAGSAEWWFIPTADVAARSCQFDDTYTFAEDGTFTIEMNGTTWVEGWQGVPDGGCEAPVAPHANGSHTYEFNETAGTLTVNGTGAFIGLAKVNNQGELPNVAVPSTITYSIAEFSGTGSDRTMKLIIEAGSGVFWTFLLEAE